MLIIKKVEEIDMFDKKVLFFKATEDGMDIDVPEPVEENVYGKAMDTVIGDNGVPVGKYGVNYHMAYIKEGSCVSRLTFEGKQDDFFYNFSLCSECITRDFKLDKKQVKKIFNKDGGGIILNWWHNNSSCTDDHGIKRVKGMLEYDIHITDKITLRVTAEPYNSYDDGIHDMIELCNRVYNNQFNLEII